MVSAEALPAVRTRANFHQVTAVKRLCLFESANSLSFRATVTASRHHFARRRGRAEQHSWRSGARDACGSGRGSASGAGPITGTFRAPLGEREPAPESLTRSPSPAPTSWRMRHAMSLSG